MIQRRHLIAGAAGLAAAPLAAPGLHAQGAAWPTQPVRLIVPFAAGGPTDIPARLLADELSKILPQRVIVENRTGAGAVVGSDVVAKAPKDGQTLLYTTIAHAAMRKIFPNLPFDPIRDFTPVALTGVIPMVCIVNKNFPANTLQELVDLIRKEPNKYDYASTGNGAALHLASELFLNRAGGLKVNHVPYRGEAAALPDLMNGTIAMMISIANFCLPFINGNEVKALAVSGTSRIPQLPNVPTFAEAGVPNYEAYTWHMVMAPTGTPAPLVQTINQTINRVMAMPSVQERLSALVMETRSNTTPETAKKWLDDEIAKWEPIIDAAGIRAS